jgi:hypothetical protein
LVRKVRQRTTGNSGQYLSGYDFTNNYHKPGPLSGLAAEVMLSLEPNTFNLNASAGGALSITSSNVYMGDLLNA